VFPSLLLVATLFRLGLNVASTRLVLGQGFAGQVIEAFGKVTVGGSLIIGAVVFLILVVIQFVVVTKGAERVAEVGARFTLCRTHHGRRSPEAPRRSLGGSRLLRRHGRCLKVRQRRRDRGHHHYHHQLCGRHRDRRAAARHGGR
jgi:hypothetical protein